VDAPDYKQLVNPQMRAFIKKCQAQFPNNATDQKIEEQRAAYQKLCFDLSSRRPEGVVSSDYMIQHIPVRRYLLDRALSESKNKNSTSPPQKRLVIYFHGGGFVLGDLDSHDDICAEICAGTGFELVSVAYRLAPEHPHPAMFEDALLTTGVLLKNNDFPVILCGDSAGGNLAAAVAHALRHETESIIGQLLIYPSLGPNTGRGSYKRHALAPMLTSNDVKFYLESRCGRKIEDMPPDKTIFPLLDDDFSDLPPTVIITADCDPLSDDGKNYTNSVKAAGGRALWINEEGLVHGFLRARREVAGDSSSFMRIIKLLLMLGKKEWTMTKK
jgi:acetyl esterase